MMGSILRTLYAKAPIWMQNIATSAYGVRLYSQRYLGTYKEYLCKYREQMFLTKEELLQIQNDEFLDIVRFSVKNSPFYKCLYKDVDIDTIKSVKDIEKLPIVTKKILKENTSSFYTIPLKSGIVSRTSGTTGIPMTSLMTVDDMRRCMAYLDAYRYQFGYINLKMRRASMFGKDIIPPQQKKKIFWRDNWAIRQRLYSTYYMSPDNMPYYIENLNKYKPKAIDGMPSAIYELAKYINQNSIQLLFEPLAIFTTSETLMDYQRREMETAFHCIVSDQYSASEGIPFITQCKCGKYHENLLTGIFEHVLLPDGRYQLLVTSFSNHAMPLIRYDVGDTVQFETNLADEKCECGSSDPVISRIGGRTVEAIVKENGAFITQPQISTMIAELPSCIKKIQFDQKRIGFVEILVVIDEGYDRNAMTIVLSKIFDRYGFFDIHYKVLYVDDIPFESSGKFRLIRNTIPAS